MKRSSILPGRCEALRANVRNEARSTRKRTGDAARARTARDTGVRRPVRDPSTMTPGQRLAELGDLLARGFRRHLVSRETGLDDAANNERRCSSVDTFEDARPQEGES